MSHYSTELDCSEHWPPPFWRRFTVACHTTGGYPVSMGNASLVDVIRESARRLRHGQLPRFRWGRWSLRAPR